MRPDAVYALAAYVERNAVSSARIVELIPASLAVRCRAGDGSEWFVATDQYATAFGWADTLPDAMRQIGTLDDIPGWEGMTQREYATALHERISAPTNSAGQQTGEYPR